MTNLLAEWLITAGVKVTDVQAMVENHLKEMILKTFDPKKADTIFTEEGEVSAPTFNRSSRGVMMLLFHKNGANSSFGCGLVGAARRVLQNKRSIPAQYDLGQLPG